MYFHADMYIYMPDIDFHLNIACSYTGVIKDIELSVIIYIVHLIYCTLNTM